MKCLHPDQCGIGADCSPCYEAEAAEMRAELARLRGVEGRALELVQRIQRSHLASIGGIRTHYTPQLRREFVDELAASLAPPAPKPKEEGPPVACHKCSEGFEVFTAGSIFPGTCARCGAAVGFGEGPLIPERTAKAMRELRAAEAEEERR